MLTQPAFEKELLRWYQKNKRNLPWRNTKEPYHIWLSEIILQQTRVKQGLPYYEAFIAHFPTVQHMAAASEQEILRLWQGLGYYSRARNMHYTAKYIVSECKGKFPSQYAELLKLKGVGKYTAAAIASFAFNEPVAVVDGNVYRVLARLFGMHHDIASTQGQKAFAKKAQSLVSQQFAADYNQAIMEFGATQCTPQKPNCMYCPFVTECKAYQEGTQTLLPIKSKKTKVRNRYFHYLVWEHDTTLYMLPRTQKGIWQGLYDFTNIETEKPLPEEDLMAAVQKKFPDVVCKLQELSPLYTHQLSHQKLHVYFCHLYLVSSPETLINQLTDAQGAFYTLKAVEALPKPILIQKYLENKFIH